MQARTTPDDRYRSARVIHSSAGMRDEGLDQLAEWLDSKFRVPGLGWRFGLDPILGFIPGVGDLLSFIPSLVIFLSGVRAGVPKITLARMGLNIALDLVIGSLPLVGDFFDSWFKANQRNVALIQRSRLAGPRARPVVMSDWLFVAGVCVVLAALLVGAIAVTLFLFGAIGDLLFSAFAWRPNSA